MSFVDSGFRSGERGHVALVSHLQTAASRSETSHDPGKKNIFPPKTRSFLILTVTFLFPVQKYEPVFTAGSQPFVHHMNVYECVGDPSVFEVLAATEGSRCYQPSMPPLFFNCNNVVVAWTAGSEVRIQFRPYQFCNKNSRFLSLFCPHKWKGFHVPIRSWLSDESGRRRQVFHARDPLRQPEPAERHRRSLGPPSLLHFSTQVTTSSYSSPIGILHGRIPPPKPAGHQRKQKTRDNWPVFFVVVTVEERGGRPPAILLQQKRLVVLLSSTSSDRNVFDLLLYFSLFFLVSLYGPLQQPQKTQGANQCLADVLDARVVNAGHLNSAPFLGSSDTTKEREKSSFLGTDGLIVVSHNRIVSLSMTRREKRRYRRWISNLVANSSTRFFLGITTRACWVSASIPIGSTSYRLGNAKSSPKLTASPTALNRPCLLAASTSLPSTSTLTSSVCISYFITQLEPFDSVFFYFFLFSLFYFLARSVIASAPSFIISDSRPHPFRSVKYAHITQRWVRSNSRPSKRLRALEYWNVIRACDNIRSLGEKIVTFQVYFPFENITRSFVSHRVDQLKWREECWVMSVGTPSVAAGTDDGCH